MTDKVNIWQGTLALMVLKTLESSGPLHGLEIARQIGRTSGDMIKVNYGTLYMALSNLERKGYITSAVGVSDTHRRARYYELTPAGRSQLLREAREWAQATTIVGQFLVEAKA